MTREISYTPIPSAELRHVGDHDEIELVCHECDLTVYADGGDLPLSLVSAIDAVHARLHRQRQEEGTP